MCKLTFSMQSIRGTCWLFDTCVNWHQSCKSFNSSTLIQGIIFPTTKRLGSTIIIEITKQKKKSIKSSVANHMILFKSFCHNTATTLSSAKARKSLACYFTSRLVPQPSKYTSPGHLAKYDILYVLLPHNSHYSLSLSLSPKRSLAWYFTSQLHISKQIWQSATLLHVLLPHYNHLSHTSTKRSFLWWVELTN